MGDVQVLATNRWLIGAQTEILLGNIMTGVCQVLHKILFPNDFKAG
jgi:hypothetical protein